MHVKKENSADCNKNRGTDFAMVTPTGYCSILA